VVHRLLHAAAADDSESRLVLLWSLCPCHLPCDLRRRRRQHDATADLTTGMIAAAGSSEPCKTYSKVMFTHLTVFLCKLFSSSSCPPGESGETPSLVLSGARGVLCCRLEVSELC
jgi:hypothetical protein